MKIFFIGDRRDSNIIAQYDKIVKEFEKNGHSVDKSYLQKSTDSDAHDFENAYKRNMLSIKKADVIVAEVTTLPSGIGFLVSTALNQKKPVLALFNKDSKSTPSTTLKGSNNKLMSFKEYSDETIEKTIKSFLNKVKNLLDTKFILIISPEIDRYLEWASDYKRMHKAQIVREAVEEMMKKDKEWKKMQS